MAKRKDTKVETEGVGVVYVGAGKPLQAERFPVRPPARGDVLLRLERSGICGTDIHIHEGRLALPFSRLILGHEFIGRVVALGREGMKDGLGRKLRRGDRAIACVAQPCGTCFNCRAGDTASCLNFGVTYFRDPQEAPHFFGGHAENLYSPPGNLVKVPRNLDLDAVASFACAGPTVIRACEVAGRLSRGELVVIQGTGPVGLFAAAWASKAGCHVVVIGSGKNPIRARLARQFGARLFLDYRRTTAEVRLKKVCALAKRLKRGNGADVVLEASGNPTAVPEGMNLVRTLGRYIVPGQYSDSGPVEILPHLITFKAIRMTGSGQYQLSDVGRYLRFIGRHKDLQGRFARCVTHKYPLSQANEAFRDASQGKSIKAVFVA